jgi:hypothetical protein
MVLLLPPYASTSLIPMPSAKAHMQWLHYFCSNNAGQCARARHILALQIPHIIWMFCWAHQVNLMVGHLMSKSTFAYICNAAVKAATTIPGSLSKRYKLLCTTIVDHLYQKGIMCTIHSLGDLDGIRYTGQLGFAAMNPKGVPDFGFRIQRCNL